MILTAQNYANAVSSKQSIEPSYINYRDVLYPLAVTEVQVAEMFRNQFQPGTPDLEAAIINYQQKEQELLTIEAERDRLAGLYFAAINNVNLTQFQLQNINQQIDSLNNENNQAQAILISRQAEYNNSKGVTVGLNIFIGKYFRY